ncbi:uncharacterized protein MKK02DRAFT_41014 [Dioszegia hungarica]|uniref:Uncharacterized protein n=1 Tax=Dioszegia hungarica TaxID=4972 RepID=A0AA38H589_9TREE|nr:uncharacterized protein MKK02DRAFT_41014 [Dioszegia hungarica]KAI9632704.1 hypothetical protein MKK02DRAFT_41014 [Dioszegia hungarica]
MPLGREAATNYLKELLVSSGLGGGGLEFGETLYIFRRGFARMMTILFGAEVARYFMGHAVGSLVLEKFYLLSPVEMEVPRGLFDGNERNELVWTALAWKRRGTGVDTAKMTLAEAARRSPIVAALAKRRLLLKASLAGGTDGWKRMRPFSDMRQIKSLNQEHLPALIRRYDNQLRRWVRSLRTNVYESAADRDLAELADEAYEEMSRGKDDGSSKLLDALHQRLVAQEAAFLGSGEIAGGAEGGRGDEVEMEGVTVELATSLIDQRSAG